MSDTQNKLAGCFAIVFPGLRPDQILAASAANIEGWDSIAQVNLLTVIGEEFGLEIDFEEFEGATSYQELDKRVRELTGSA